MVLYLTVPALKEDREELASPSSKGWDFIPNTYGDERILE
jgi:hypothetical protein